MPTPKERRELKRPKRRAPITVVRLYAPQLICRRQQHSDMASPEVTQPKGAVPLCVDLDGTLIKTDVVWESLVLLLRHKPLYCLAVPFWLMFGRAYLKSQLARRVKLDPSSLPYNESFLEFLK